MSRGQTFIPFSQNGCAGTGVSPADQSDERKGRDEVGRETLSLRSPQNTDARWTHSTRYMYIVQIDPLPL